MALNDEILNIMYYQDDEPVGTGGAAIIDDGLFLFNGSVLSKARGNKIQQAMINYRMKYAKDNNLKYVYVSTGVNTTSGRNMERMGFQKAFTV